SGMSAVLLTVKVRGAADAAELIVPSSSSAATIGGVVDRSARRVAAIMGASGLPLGGASNMPRSAGPSRDGAMVLAPGSAAAMPFATLLPRLDLPREGGHASSEPSRSTAPRALPAPIAPA